MNVKRFFISLVISFIILSIVFFISNDFGITWDEPIHIRNADKYVAWLKQPIFSDKDKFFAADTEDVHPPFRKLVAGLTHEILTNRLRILDNTRGYRLSSLLFVVPFITFFTYIAIGQFGYAIGIGVPTVFSLLPHVLFLTPLITMDYAIAAMWFIAVVAAYKGVKKPYWLIAAGISIGLTMLTKLHGFLLFLPVCGYLVWKKQWWNAVLVAAVAVAVFVVGWPWLWTQPFSHLAMYFQIQRVHGSVPEYIFGTTYAFAPWWYTPVVFLTTTPAIVLLLYGIGIFWIVRRGKEFDWLIFFNSLYPIIFFSLPGVYRYDWVRLFLPAFPFVCLVAGRAVLAIPKQYRIIPVLFWVITLYTSLIRIHPYESSYYNEFVGGVAGAHALGMESEFWGNAYLGILPWMNENKKYQMCVTPTTHPFYYYQAMGQIEPGVFYTAGRNDCDFVVVLMRQGLFSRDAFIDKIVRTRNPVHTVSLNGVPLVAVYDIRTTKE